jgi:hypothetical protein
MPASKDGGGWCFVEHVVVHHGQLVGWLVVYTSINVLTWHCEQRLVGQLHPYEPLSLVMPGSALRDGQLAVPDRQTACHPAAVCSKLCQCGD